MLRQFSLQKKNCLFEHDFLRRAQICIQFVRFPKPFAKGTDVSSSTLFKTNNVSVTFCCIRHPTQNQGERGRSVLKMSTPKRG